MPKKKFPKIISRSLANSIQQYFRNKVYDIIHIHWLYPDALCIPKLHEMGNRCVLTIHGSDWYKNAENSYLLPLFKQVFLKADYVFFVGDQLQDDITARFPILNDKSSVIYNSVDGEKYSIPTSIEKDQSLKELGWDIRKKHFLCVASSQKEKGVDLLVQAVGKISDEFSDFQLHVVGSNNPKILKTENSSGKIHFHPTVSPDELIKYYHASDAYILPSRKEGFGLAMIEAATTGLPLVANPTGIATAFIDENIGILGDEISSDSIARSISKLIQNLDNYSRRSIRGKALALFGKEIYRDRLLKQYQILID
ncbi:MAG: glycosyltransferase family 4 protein [Balneolaceae bacterium]